MKDVHKVELKVRQTAVAKVESKMLEFLIQFDPAGALKLNDAKVIAKVAREIAFEAFCPPVLNQ